MIGKLDKNLTWLQVYLVEGFHSSIYEYYFSLLERQEKMSLGYALKEVIEKRYIIGSVKSEIRLRKINIRNSCKIFQETRVQYFFGKQPQRHFLKYS